MNASDRLILAKLAREERIAALREGRKNRSTRIESKKVYTRKVKHSKRDV